MSGEGGVWEVGGDGGGGGSSAEDSKRERERERDAGKLWRG